MTNSMLTLFQYARIKAAFPKFWLDRINTNQRREQTMLNDRLIQIKTGDLIDISNTKTKQFYSLFVNLNRICHPSVLYHWQESLYLPDEFDWSILFKFKFG